MKFVKVFKILLALFIFFSCSSEETKQETPNPITYFTLTIDEDWQSDISESQDWIIIHGVDGNLLDYRSFKKGESISFEAMDNENLDNLTITLFLSYTRNDGKTIHVLSTNPEIKKGSKWSLIGPRGQEPLEDNPQIGTFNLTVNNIPEEFIRYGLSSPNRGRISNGEYSLENNNLYKLSFQNVLLHKNNNFILSVLENDKNLRYFEILDVKNDDNIVLDYNNLQNFDNYLTIDLSNHNRQLYIVNAKEDENDFKNLGYLLHQNFFSPSNQLPRDFLKIGYLDKLKTYNIIISISFNDYQYRYNRHGSPLTNLSIPQKPNLNLIDDSLFNFSFNPSTSYVKRISRWAATNGDFITEWQVSSQNNTNPRFSLPDELKTKYPNINVEGLKYLSSDLFLKSESYSDFINRQFVSHEIVTERDEEYVVIQNN